MRPRDPRLFLWDVADSCGAILEFTEGCTFQDYAADRLLRSAIERRPGRRRPIEGEAGVGGEPAAHDIAKAASCFPGVRLVDEEKAEGQP